MKLLSAAAWLAIVAWLLVRAFRQRDSLEMLAPSPPPPAHSSPEIAAIIPARDEAANIGACLETLIGQDYPSERLRIIVVDDHSNDDTAAIVARIAAGHPQVSLLCAPPLPPNWIGKSHACWIGARAAPADTEWLCFLDADVRAEPALLASAVGAACEEAIDFLSLAPRQELGSFAERLILPCGLYLLAFRQDLRRVQAPEGRDATATGQFILLRRSEYDALGGHAAVSGVICEDLELARLFKRSGDRVLLRGGQRLLSTRMYTGWRTLWPGIAKNLVDTLGGPAATLRTAAVALALSWAAVLLPFATALSCMDGAGTGCLASAVAGLGSAAALAFHVAGASYFGIPFWYGFLFPLAYTIGAVIAVDSVRQRWRGRVSWKGRTYP